MSLPTYHIRPHRVKLWMQDAFFGCLLSNIMGIYAIGTVLMSWLCLGNHFRIRVMSQQRSFSTFLNCAAYVARTISGIRTQLLYLHVYCPSFQFSSLSAAFDKRQITCISYSNNNLTSIRIIGYCRETETYAMDAHPQWQQSRLIATGECRWGWSEIASSSRAHR